MIRLPYKQIELGSVVFRPQRAVALGSSADHLFYIARYDLDRRLQNALQFLLNVLPQSDGTVDIERVSLAPSMRHQRRFGIFGSSPCLYTASLTRTNLSDGRPGGRVTWVLP
jgi:hypothetical protein